MIADEPGITVPQDQGLAMPLVDVVQAMALYLDDNGEPKVTRV